MSAPGVIIDILRESTGHGECVDARSATRSITATSEKPLALKRSVLMLGTSTVAMVRGTSRTKVIYLIALPSHV